MAKPNFGRIAGWGAKETLAGDRLPYLSLIDENVVLLRDGSLMLSLLVPGLAFETADTDDIETVLCLTTLFATSQVGERSSHVFSGGEMREQSECLADKTQWPLIGWPEVPGSCIRPDILIKTYQRVFGGQ